MDHERTIVPAGPDGPGEATLSGDETEPAAGDRAAPRLSRGASIDRYVVVDELGVGGMGVVYLAYDPELDRRVAIKVLLPFLVGEGRPRLVREAQAIARIAHPNVVAVHDVGEIDGSVFVAMEFVEGQTLGRWLHAEPRSIAQILDVFGQAGRGLAAAHAADLVHRDFKPENVLLGVDERVRVVDFGLARGRGAEDSVSPRPGISSSSLDENLTELGTVMGTPAFMAPEQLAGETATAASDQFAFCVALYHALYGERPFAGTTLASLSASVFGGSVRPPPPGSRVPSWLRRVLLRGLQTQPADRYPSMHELLHALERDPSVARRRIAIASTLGVGMLGLAALAYRSGTDRERSACASATDDLRPVWNDERSAALAAAFEQTGLPYANDTWSRVRARVEDYTAKWAEQATEACEATHVRRDQSVELLEHRRRCLAERLQRLDAFLEVIAHPEDTVVDHAVQGAGALPDLDGCRDTKALEAGIAPPEQESTRREVELVREALTRAEALSAAARYRDQVELLGPLLERARVTSYLPIIAAVEHALARAQRSLDLPEGSVTLRAAFRDALAAGDDRRAAMAAVDLAHEYGYEQRLHEQGREWIGIAESLLYRLGGDPRVEIGMINTLAIIAIRQARYDESLALFERLVEMQRELDPDNPNLAVGLMNLGSAYAERRDFARARGYLKEAADLTERTLGPQHPSMTSLWANLAMIALLQGEHEEAETELARALALQLEVLGPRHLEYARSLASMAVVKRNRGDLAESERLHRQALAIRREKLGPDHPEVGESMRNLAHTLWDQGRTDEAIALTLEAQQTAQRRLAPEHPEHGTNAAFLAALFADAGRFDEALAAAERAIAILGPASPDPTSVLDAQRAKGQAERGLGRHDASIATLEAALARAQDLEVKPTLLAMIRFDLGASLVAAGRDPARGHQLVDRARAVLAEAPPGYRLDRARIDAWIAEHPTP